jgi:hypothetical protein
MAAALRNSLLGSEHKYTAPKYTLPCFRRQSWKFIAGYIYHTIFIGLTVKMGIQFDLVELLYELRKESLTLSRNYFSYQQNQSECLLKGTHGIVVGWGTRLQAGSSRIRDPMKSSRSSAALGPGIYSASDRNECQKEKIMLWESRGQPAPKTDNFTALCEPIL